MATSFVRYRGKGFWSYDPYLEHLLALLSGTILEPVAEPWLLEAKQHWLRQSSGDFAAFMHPRLDEILSNDARRDRVLELIAAAARARGSTPEVRATADLLAKLLEGRLTTDESSPREYMVAGALPYEWR